MLSSDALTEFKHGPLYFFDQPTGRNRIKGARSKILRFSASEGQRRCGDASKQENDNKKDELTERLMGETHRDGTPDTSPAVCSPSIKDHSPVDAYKRAAPQLLDELAGLLSPNQWIVKKYVPHGIINILNYSWQELVAGALYWKRPEQTYKRPESRGSENAGDTTRPASAADQKETERSGSRAVGNYERKTQVSSGPCVKTVKQDSKTAPTSATDTFSLLSTSCKRSGWIIRPPQPCFDDPQHISLCQWVVKRLQAARSSGRLQTGERNQDKPLVLRHYVSAKTKPNDRSTARKAQPATLVNGIPQIPELKQQNPGQRKLHYRIDDGSSFIYYPSGCVAVCQSHSGLPCGGFYTNVLSDGQCPAVLATITAFGHGAATHPPSSAITALWDQDGGFICDQLGNVIKEWRWKSDHTLGGKIVIQLSDLISVKLFSGTSAQLSFRCNSECVQLPLSALSKVNRPKDMVRQMVRTVEGLGNPSAHWKRGGHAPRELKRLQRRVRNTVDNWLAYYREAIGIKCPDIKRMPNAPLRTRPGGEVQSAALPSLNPPERTDAKTEHGGKQLQRHLLAWAERPPDTSIKLLRTPKKQEKEATQTHIGPLQIHGNIQPESVIIPNSLQSQPYAVGCYPAPLSFTPSVPLTVCPVLLRAALLGEGGRKRCSCSSARMPIVTDMEYDTFVMGQPPHSKQILVVCVTQLQQPVRTQAVRELRALEQLYRRRNKHRTMPCTQCQMDSFRLVRYEIPTVELGCGVENVLLQQRHNAAPGMVLMYIGGKLLFVGYIFCDHSCSVMDFQKQISRARGDYRSGVSLPPDYKLSDTAKTAAHTDAHKSQDVTLVGRDDVMLLATVEKEEASERHKKHQSSQNKAQMTEVLLLQTKRSSCVSSSFCYHTANVLQGRDNVGVIFQSAETFRLNPLINVQSNGECLVCLRCGFIPMINQICNRDTALTSTLATLLGINVF